MLLILILILVQAEKRRQSGLPWIFVTALMIVAQIVGASLAATDFGEEYNVNFLVIVMWRLLMKLLCRDSGPVRK